MARLASIETVGFLLVWMLAALSADAKDERATSIAKPAQAKAAAVAKTVLLDIPETGEERRQPPSGWCGEASIQMAMSYFGAYASQKAINRAGKPAHPDLYEDEMPAAMTNVGLETRPWQGKGLREYLAWVRAELAAGHPVVVGMKVNPTGHPEWYVDHFVLAVGCTPESLTLNTTWMRRETRSDAQLCSQEKGLSIANPHNIYFGCAATGMDLIATPADARPTHVKLVRKGDNHVELRAIVENLEQGKRYRLVRFTDLESAKKPGASGACEVVCGRRSNAGFCGNDRPGRGPCLPLFAGTRQQVTKLRLARSELQAKGVAVSQTRPSRPASGRPGSARATPFPRIVSIEAGVSIIG